jgi:catechol 2,3-dioxygenase-like lactoylglutathione lyase family enzyme
MKRLHVHISVANLADSIRFYSGMFASEPSVVKTDYAKWMLEDPRVNFAISQRGAATGLNHLGVQVESENELADMHARLKNTQGDIVEETAAACCYAQSDKYWVTDPEGIAWETFHTLDSIPVFGGDAPDACCVPSTSTFKKADQQSGCCAPNSNCC